MLAGSEGVLVATQRLNDEPTYLNKDLPFDKAIEKLASTNREDLANVPVTSCLMNRQDQSSGYLSFDNLTGELFRLKNE